jgi:hypothetical protein
VWKRGGQLAGCDRAVQRVDRDHSEVHSHRERERGTITLVNVLQRLSK